MGRRVTGIPRPPPWNRRSGAGSGASSPTASSSRALRRRITRTSSRIMDYHWLNWINNIYQLWVNDKTTFRLMMDPFADYIPSIIL